MIKSVQFSEGRLSLAISGLRSGTSAKRECSIEFDFGEGGAVTELHSREFMDFLYSVYPEGSTQVRYLVFELFGTQSRVRRVDLHLLYSPCEGLQDSGAPNVLVELASGAGERASGEEQVSLSFGKRGLDR
jgi:hypothetical protein